MHYKEGALTRPGESIQCYGHVELQVWRSNGFTEAKKTNYTSEKSNTSWMDDWIACDQLPLQLEQETRADDPGQILRGFDRKKQQLKKKKKKKDSNMILEEAKQGKGVCLSLWDAKTVRIIAGAVTCELEIHINNISDYINWKEFHVYFIYIYLCN